MMAKMNGSLSRLCVIVLVSFAAFKGLVYGSAVADDDNGGLNVALSSNEPQYTNSNEEVAFEIRVDKKVWFRGLSAPILHGISMELHGFTNSSGHHDQWGEYDLLTWKWADGTATTRIATTVATYKHRELVIFTQTWLDGYSPPNTNTTRASPFLASFPTLDTRLQDEQDLKYLGWGDCFLANTMSGSWSQNMPDLDGVTSGIPLVWHDLQGRTVVMSPTNNFFVAGQAIVGQEWLECGIRDSVNSLPPGFSHSTVLLGGHGINNTMMAWGDLLLDLGEKKRTDPYEDFVLSHLGYWTDNGAYYYHLPTIPGFANEEEALKAIKVDLLDRGIPVRYFQWDDWWMDSKGDVPGMTSWTPISSVFPSGFTDWLGQPLSLYAPMYSKENVWVNDYTWKIDTKKDNSAIPLDGRFYKDLFTNGTKIGMKMFEQDFLCTTNTETSLTNSDVDSGALWMKQMDQAAADLGVTLQWCMMNACHALHSTLVKTMTNGRATDDNCRGAPHNIESMGQNGLLFYSLGFFPSRDNVWTTPPDVEQKGCNPYEYCYEPNALVDNAVALLGGGPYGPADAVGLTGYDVVMRATRSDGLLLRPSWPLSSLDATFLKEESQLPLVWAAHDDYSGVGRWSYIVGVNLEKPFFLKPSDLLQQSMAKGSAAAVAWRVQLRRGDASSELKVTRFNSSYPLEIPMSPPEEQGPGATVWAAAPILSNGMALLGDVSKWATMSTRRVQQMKISDGALSAIVVGAPGEMVPISSFHPSEGGKIKIVNAVHLTSQR